MFQDRHLLSQCHLLFIIQRRFPGKHLERVTCFGRAKGLEVPLCSQDHSSLATFAYVGEGTSQTSMNGAAKHRVVAKGALSRMYVE